MKLLYYKKMKGCLSIGCRGKRDLGSRKKGLVAWVKRCSEALFIQRELLFNNLKERSQYYERSLSLTKTARLSLGAVSFYALGTLLQGPPPFIFWWYDKGFSLTFTFFIDLTSIKSMYQSPSHQPSIIISWHLYREGSKRRRLREGMR